ncbi:MAG TPA: hypothetical protein VFU40_06985 [Gemmatimonadales bacterium]|nr:hypothetical protein [Gemmatimonadales bacterium]
MRPTCPLRALAALLVLSAAGSAPAHAQWLLGLELGSDRFWGGSRETTAAHRSFRPYRPTTVGLALTRAGSRWGLGLQLRYTSAGLALEGSDALVAAKGIFDVYGAAPELRYRLTGIASNELAVQGGPLVELWSVRGEESQTRLGIWAAVSLRVPLGGRFAGSASAGAALTGSPFTSDQLEPGFERRALWRRRLAGRLEYRL